MARTSRTRPAKGEAETENSSRKRSVSVNGEAALDEAKRGRGRRGGRRAARAERTSRKPQPMPATTRGIPLPHTLADVSRYVGVSATTIKYYLNHLPRLIEFEGQGRKRRFSERALEMLKAVRRGLQDENKSLGQIRQELESNFPPSGAHAATLPAAHGSLEELMGVLVSEVRALRAEVERLRRTRWVPGE
ncbi:MAG: MerR family transcriptional regulator [Candidatus Xenobia bacterium]